MDGSPGGIGSALGPVRRQRRTTMAMAATPRNPRTIGPLLTSVWTLNEPTTRAHGIIPRELIEESADRLVNFGITNQLLIVDILAALSGLKREEVRFNVDLGLQKSVFKKG